MENKIINSTLQISDGDHIAQITGIITISDFRQKHIAAGGEGAPLAVYGDYLLFGNVKKDIILLNIGGISNFTFLPREKKNIVCSDIGPGNTLLDAWTQAYFHQPMDMDAQIASRGKVHEKLLSVLLHHPFFTTTIPKTCGQEIFHLRFVKECIEKTHESISPEDVLATLHTLTSKTIADQILKLISNSLDFYISGGGLHNPLLVSLLQQYLPWANFQSTETIGVSPDAKEAVLFALLANESVAGNIDTWENAGISPAISMGKISLPH